MELGDNLRAARYVMKFFEYCRRQKKLDFPIDRELDASAGRPVRRRQRLEERVAVEDDSRRLSFPRLLPAFGPHRMFFRFKEIRKLILAHTALGKRLANRAADFSQRSGRRHQEFSCRAA